MPTNPGNITKKEIVEQIATAMAETFDAWPEATAISTDAPRADVAQRARMAFRASTR